jgi:hypothetical protein
MKARNSLASRNLVAELIRCSGNRRHRPQGETGVRRQGQGEEGGEVQIEARSQSKEGCIAIRSEGGERAALCKRSKMRQGEPALVSPLTLIPPGPDLARGLRGRSRVPSL